MRMRPVLLAVALLRAQPSTTPFKVRWTLAWHNFLSRLTAWNKADHVRFRRVLLPAPTTLPRPRSYDVGQPRPGGGPSGSGAEPRIALA